VAKQDILGITMESYIYKITLKNGKSYIGFKIGKKFNDLYMSSSTNKQYWIDLKEYGIKEHVILEELEFKKKSSIISIESKHIKENGLWPDTYNFSYYENGKLVNTLKKYETMTKEDYKEYKKLYDKARYQKNKEKIKSKIKVYGEKNKETISKKKKEYRENNKEHIKEYMDKYREDHYCDILKKNQEYKKRHYEKILKNNREYQRKKRKPV
jgi:hypothetical protein